MKRVLELLAQRLALVPGVSRETIFRLDTLPVKREVHPAGKQLLGPGGKFDGIFLIERGWVSLHVELEDGTNQVLSFLLPGQFVGLGALAYPAAVWSFTTASHVTLVRFQPDAVNALLDLHPDLSKLFMIIALMQLGRIGERLIDIGRRSAYHRTGRLILELWSHLHDVGMADVDGFEFPINQKLMADAVGLTDVHLNRMLRRLKSDGLISIERDRDRRVHIIDRHAAVSELQFDTARFPLPGFK